MVVAVGGGPIRRSVNRQSAVGRRSVGGQSVGHFAPKSIVSAYIFESECLHF